VAKLSLKNIVKRYGEHPIIHDASLEIEDGEFIVFVGPSGCGKSTLLRMIAGLEAISDGEISIDGVCVNKMEAAERGIAMVFQSYALYPHMTVEQNLSFGLRMNGNPPADTQERVRRAAAILQIEPLMGRKPKQLSGGQRQRVAIGRAIVRQPKVFLFDEPLSNLDAELRVQMRVEIAKLHKTLGNTMIYVTHDQTEAMTLADRIVVLRAGRIEQIGRPLELYDNPGSQFVAGFIGSPKMNFLPVRVVARHEKTVELALPGITRPLTFSLTDHVRPSDEIFLGVRPEHFGAQGAGDIDLPLLVDVVERLGSTSYLYAHFAEKTRLVIEQPQARQIDHGSAITVSLQAENCFLFNAAGERLR